MAGYAAYIRRSTFEQENEHQREEIRRFLEDEGASLGDAEVIAETASGASRDREGLEELMGSIRAGDVDHVVVWELSRIAREGELAQRFFNLCEDHGVHVHVTSGSIREIKPDGTNRFVADILAAVYAEERRTLIRRTKYGQQRALDNDKWVGKPPLGFTTDDDGYLVANVELYDGHNPDRDGFYAVAGAMEALEGGGSYRGVAADLQCSRRALADTHKDESRRRRYLEREAKDHRVQNALNELTELEVEG